MKAPAGYYIAPAVHNETQALACPEPAVPYTGPLQFNSKYEGSGKSRDTLNKAANQRYLDATENIRAYEKQVESLSDDILQAKPGAYRCLMHHLNSWAQAGALQDRDANGTGKAVRKWALAAIASAYLKARLAPLLNLDTAQTDASLQVQYAAIDTWIGALAAQVIEDYRDRPDSKANNHDYWAGWAVMASGVAVNNPQYVHWARNKLTQGLAHIDQDGYLPNEMKRKTRALSYHNFAIKPLVMMAVFAQANGQGLSDHEQRQLALLVNNILLGIRNPAAFVERTGAGQEMDGLETHHALAWLEAYHTLALPFNVQVQAYLNELRPMRSTRLGGNLTYLFSRNPQDSR